jgi:signal transduction histidine kinase
MKKVLLLLITLLFSVFCISQNPSSPEIDSLLTVLKSKQKPSDQLDLLAKISKSYRFVNPEEGIKYGEKALKIAQSLKSKDQEANSLNAIGMNYYNISEVDKAKDYFSKAIKLAKDKAILCDAYTNLGKYYLAIADYSNSLKYNYTALKLSEETNLLLQSADAAYAIGMTYNFLENSEKALQYFKYALKLNTKIKRKIGICSNLSGISNQYEYRKDFETAKKYMLQARTIAYEINEPYAIATTNCSLGNILFNLNDTDNALECIISAKKTAIQINHNRLISNSEFLEGRIYLKLYKSGEKYKNVDLLTEAEKLFKSCIAMSQASGNKSVISQYYEGLSDVYSLKNEHKKAKEMYIIFTKYQDSIYSEETKQTVKTIEDKRTIDLRNKEIQLSNLKLANKEKQKWYLIGGILLLCIIGALLFYQSRNRKKTNEKLQLLNTELDEANKAKTRFFSILNHDLRGPVASLVSFLQLQKESPEMLDEETTKRMQDKTISGAENLLNSMEDILQWSKSQMENFKPQPKNVFISSLFDDVKNHFSSEEAIAISFENQDNLKLNTDENYLKTIIRNLTGNSVKALKDVENPLIIWKAWKENNQTYLSITDNGPGASQEEFKALYDDKEVVGIKSGLGLHLIRDLAKAIGCELIVETKINSGTTITLKLK